MAVILYSLGLGENYDSIIVGAIMPLLPGMAMTNAVRDIVQGDLLSGTTRIVEAILVGVAIAVGVGVVLKLFVYFGGLSI